MQAVAMQRSAFVVFRNFRRASAGFEVFSDAHASLARGVAHAGGRQQNFSQLATFCSHFCHRLDGREHRWSTHAAAFDPLHGACSETHA